jgi:hypothetical protein
MVEFFMVEAVMRSCFKKGVLGVVALGLLLAGGCYVSQYTLGPAEQATVNKDYVGNWRFTPAGAEAGTLVVRNIDGRRYYVEWDQKDKDPVRMAGFVSRVKQADFVQLRKLSDDGSLDNQWLIARVEFKDGKLQVRQLDEAFFKKQTIHSGEDLRKVIEGNLDNGGMYEKEAGVGERVEK